MKPALLVLGVIATAAIGRGLIAPALDDVATRSLSADAQLALDVRCGAPRSDSARACRDRFERLYAAGSLDPDKTLRTYCESVRTARWGGGSTTPPRLCVERYGGW